MKSLIADFVQFSSAIGKFLFLQVRLSTVSMRFFSNFLISLSLKSFSSSWRNSYLLRLPFLILFTPMFHFYSPLKTLENFWFSDIFRGYRNRTLTWNGLMKNKFTIINLTLERTMSLSYRNQSIDWFLYEKEISR